jgi:hypothetical protein
MVADTIELYPEAMPYVECCDVLRTRRPRRRPRPARGPFLELAASISPCY